MEIVMKQSSISEHVSTGQQMYHLVEELFPICRSITGNGVRKTLDVLKKQIPLNVFEVPSGTQAFDWKVPREWNIEDGWIKNSKGEKIVDFRKNNLHVLNYSVPVNKKVSLAELKEHLHFLPAHPDWVPYRTSYYKEDWGFCISYNDFLKLKEDEYEVVINSSLAPGSLTYAECYLPGEIEDEVIISAHVCHPSLANDNLSGISVATFLIKWLMQQERRYSYRFIFIPGTIGAITWLSQNERTAHKIKHGLVASLLGDKGAFTYKRSRRGDTEIDRAAEHVLMHRSDKNKVINFIPYGYDERQFCSPGFNLPVGCLSRTTYGQYPEYHTSADNLTLVSAASLEESLDVYKDIVSLLEKNKRYINLKPKCEPQLGVRGLYSHKGGDNNEKDYQMALLWVLSLSDGENSLLDISQRSGMKFESISYAADRLLTTDLLKEA